MYPGFANKLGFKTWVTDIRTQKIDSFKLDTFEIVIVFFQVKDKEKRSRFFDKTFLLADISINIALKMLFLTLSNIEINFHDWELS